MPASPAELRHLADTVRRTILDRSFEAGVGHIGSALSVVEMLVAAWGSFLRNPAADDVDRDRFILCKGHAALALYAVMHALGRIDDAALASYCRDGSLYGAHPECGIPGVEVGTGSLGQGLSVACGIALALKKRRSPARVVALLSDAECNEGQVWEAAQFAAHHRLSNLIALVDANGMQALGPTAGILDLESLDAKWTAFGWEAATVDGHDACELAKQLDERRGLSPPDCDKRTAASSPAGINPAARQNNRPRMLVCRTHLGNGVSFMQDRHDWHYRNLTPELYAQAVGESR
jgi:transketolase